MARSIVDASRRNSIYFPCGYSTFNKHHPGHAVGIALSSEHIAFFNGGEGIESYHVLDNAPPYFPQCYIAFDVLPAKRLHTFIKRMIIINRRYANTNIHTVYQEIFRLYYYNLLKHHHELVKTNVLTYIKSIFASVQNMTIEATPIAVNLYSVFTRAQKPILKHTHLYELVEYCLLFDTKQLQKNLNFFISKTFLHADRQLHTQKWGDLLSQAKAILRECKDIPQGKRRIQKLRVATSNHKT